MSALFDQAARDRFITEVDSNFSVIAPAGVGKTRAIVDRFVHLATRPDASQRLPRMVVVTYTNKAADEMQQRARAALLERDAGAVLGDFNRAFFGTIHSFCMSLLNVHGHYLGLPCKIDLATDDDEAELWVEFFRQFDLTTIERVIPREILRSCFRHLRVQDVIELARVAHPRAVPGNLSPRPAILLDEVLNYPATGAGRANILRGQASLRQWMAQDSESLAFLPIPSIDLGGEAFTGLCHDALTPLRSWLSDAGGAIAGVVAREYEQYRTRAGLLTYADQIRLVSSLLAHPDAGPVLRREAHAIILDEAQDTDPDQFRVLLELARPPQARGQWMDGAAVPPERGRFSMVGDPQQSIYGKRADLSFYQKVRQQLIEAKAAEELAFHVTFRCSQSVITSVNRLGPDMLHGRDGQVSYVELVARPDAEAGAVRRIPLSLPDPNVSPSEDPLSAPTRPMRIDALAGHEARFLAAWLRHSGPAALQASSWSEVAILCARKRWIDPIALALEQQGIPAQNHSNRMVRIDDPVFGWLAGLARVMAEPANGFELAGILREVYGLSDDALFHFCRRPASLRIDQPPSAEGPIDDLLRHLASLRTECLAMPLLDAAEHLVTQTQLCARLAAVFRREGAEIRSSLDALLSTAASAEADGLTLREWAEQIIRSADTPAEPAAPHEEAVQLITCHAAKGLEWDAVILPFMSRPIMTAPSHYPYVHEDREHGVSTMVFGTEWLDEANDRRVRQARFHETQRLLYVAMTRARRSLLFVDDALLFPKQSRESFASCLGLVDQSPSLESWNRLPEFVPPVSHRVPQLEERVPESIAPTAGTSGLSLDAVRAAAQHFPRRVLPHTLARHRQDAEPEAALASETDWATGMDPGAIRYGTWWHETVESLDWKHPRSWEERFRQRLPLCPHPVRAGREWQQWVNTPLAAYLARSSVAVYTEVPFLFPDGPDRCLEGSIDLLAFSGDGADVLVMDWKTNVTTSDRLNELWATYEPQVAAYVRAVEACIPSHPRVRGALYSTVTGRLLPDVGIPG